jgi:hypothetical protein
MQYCIQIVVLLVLAIPVAWISWTVTHEEVFRELQECCQYYRDRGRSLAVRKFFYLFTCEYCFSHWVTLILQFIFCFQMIYDDWRGYFVAFAALVWIANLYMNLYLRTRVDIREKRASADRTEQEVEKRDAA